MSKSDSAQK